MIAPVPKYGESGGLDVLGDTSVAELAVIRRSLLDCATIRVEVRAGHTVQERDAQTNAAHAAKPSAVLMA